MTRFCKKPYLSESRQLLFSMTKSFTSLAIGIAMDQKLLSSDDFFMWFFPDKMPEHPHPNLRKMRIKHLLSMPCGIHDNTYYAVG